MKVPGTKTWYMNICSCSIFDGKSHSLGLSSAFEYPKEIVSLVIEDGLEIDEAMLKTKLTENKRIGYSGGTIGLLTKGRLPRKDYVKQAVMMALIHLENKELFQI